MKKKADSISIVGLGYVGLCTAATFASRGFKTIGIDIDEERVRKVQKGKAPIHEPELDRILRTATRMRRLDASTSIATAADTSMTFLTVGTPSRPDGSIDASYIEKSAEELGGAIREKEDYHLVVVKSTVVPGTTSKTVKPILEKSSGKRIGSRIGLCANPEFLREGTAIQDALNPDKIVIGADDGRSSRTLERFYKSFYGKKTPPIISTSPETAELIKYASNAFLATKVSFINTIANIAQHIPGVDVETVAETIGRDPRIGPLFLKAGPGYGGSCFHKDLQALIHFSQDNGYDPILIRATEETNEEQANRVVALSEKLVGNLEKKKIAVLGLAFKKDTDDIREAASVRIIDRLYKKGAEVIAYDPMAITNAKKVLPEEIQYATDTRSALENADCAIIVTEWDQVQRLRPKDFQKAMKSPNIVDARRVHNAPEFAGVNYLAIGHGPGPLHE